MLKKYYLARKYLTKDINKKNILSKGLRTIYSNFRPYLQAKNYYDVLELDTKASEKDVKQAFFKKAKKLHPDTNPDDPNAKEKFAEVNEAYQVLSDKKKRAEYDRFGTTNETGSQDFSNFSNIHDIFENLFGMGIKQKGEKSSKFDINNKPGNDIQVELNLKFEDTIEEYKGDIRVNTEERCKTCTGLGTKPGSTPNKCSYCTGSGILNRQNGFMIIQQTCPYCLGEGQIKDQCNICNGHGLVMKQKTLGIVIPGGVDDGMRVRIPNQGSASRFKGKRGNLYVICHIKPHYLYERVNSNLHLKIVISMSTAILGGLIEVPLLDGKKIKHNLPSGLQNGHVEMLKGKGLPDPNSGLNGNLHIHLVVRIPCSLNIKQKELVREFQKLEDFKEIQVEKPELLKTHKKTEQKEQQKKRNW